jgi:molybdenum cofactor cytidylyltransferase
MTDPASRPAAIVLAAGEASRFGSQKLLSLLRGRPLIQHVVDAACASSLEPVVVVLGADADAIAARLEPGRARIVRNAEYATGQASSLRAGVRAMSDASRAVGDSSHALTDMPDAVVVLLGDQPLVTAALLEALVARQHETGASAVMCSQDGRRSPPTLLHRVLWPEIEGLQGDTGAREILAGRSDVATFFVGHAVANLGDIDHPEDLSRLQTPNG